MLVKSKVIVLHTLKYGESRIIVDMFTREAGRLSCIVSIPKTPHGRLKKQYFQPMTLLEVEMDIRQKAQLQKLRDARLLSPYTSIPFSPEKLALSLFVAEFLCYALRSEQQNTILFDYICDSVQWLDMASDGFANFHLTFLMRLSRFLGFYPNLEERGKRIATPHSQREKEEGGEVREMSETDFFFDLRESRFCTDAPVHRDFLQPHDAEKIRLLMRMDFPTMHLFQLSRIDRNRITEVLLHYYRLHIPQFPEMKSLGVLQELFY